jgi:predicted transposase/invertase (TIGR01784 family)
VEYAENLKMSREDRKMYVSIFEEVYTQRGMEKGMEEGAKAKAVEIAKNLLSRGVSSDIIAESSGLSPEEVRSLMN